MIEIRYKVTMRLMNGDTFGQIRRMECEKIQDYVEMIREEQKHAPNLHFEILDIVNI